MRTGKKVLDVLGIIFAWLLSIALIALLVAAPITLSALTQATPKNLSKAVTQIDFSLLLDAVSNGQQEEADGETAVLNAFMSTDAAKEILKLYVLDLTNALFETGENPQLNAETFSTIVKENIDEMVVVFREISPEMEQMPDAALKAGIEEMFVAGAGNILASLPTGEMMKTQLIGDDPTLKVALDVLAMSKTIRLIYVGILVGLSLLIFLCRLFGFRGFRWLAVDLFVASGISGLVCVGLSIGTSLIPQLIEDSASLSGLITPFLTAFTSGVILRTGIMLASAVVLLVAYILIKKARKKKVATLAAPVVAAVEAPAENLEATPEETQ